jgi:hypothetical protein
VDPEKLTGIATLAGAPRAARGGVGNCRRTRAPHSRRRCRAAGAGSRCRRG